MYDPCLFCEGLGGRTDVESIRKIYEFFGVHKEGEKYLFRAYFPDAHSVELSGDFNSWGGDRMKSLGGGVFETEVAGDGRIEGTCYKYRVCDGEKCELLPDPFARYAQSGRYNASIVYFGEYEWEDGDWMASRRGDSTASPVNIYQVHPSTWKTRNGRGFGEGDLCLNYRDLAPELARYVSEMGYTHVCLMSVMAGESGFAPSSKQGRPDDLRALVDALHREGVGVISEWEWGINVPYGTESVMLAASAAYWLLELHMDGLYLSGAVGENTLTTLCKELDFAVFVSHSELGETKNALLVDKKWSENTLGYATCDPQYKRFKYPIINRSLTEGFEKNRLLSVPWEEVSRGKKSLLMKMRGDYRERFARLRLFYCYMMTHPGKKMTFMGCEIGESAEWSGDGQLDWFLLDQEANGSFKNFVGGLNRTYLENAPLWEMDSSWRGFEWIMPLDPQEGLTVYKRISREGEVVIAAMNFTDNREREVRIEEVGEMTLLLNSDEKKFGGKGRGELRILENGAKLSVPPLSALLVKVEKNKMGAFFEKTLDYSLGV